MKLSVSLVALLGAVDGAFVQDMIPRHQKVGGSSNGKMFDAQDHFQPQAQAQAASMQKAPQIHMGNDFQQVHIKTEPVIASENLDGHEVISTLPDGRTINTADPDLTASAFTTNQFNAQNMLQCTAGALTVQTQCMTPEMYDDITSEIQFVHQNSATGDAQADFAGCILRMAGHDFMDHMPASSGAPASQRGGSDGCVDFNDPDNGGLAPCLQQLSASYNKVGMSSFNNKAVCEKVSLADFLVIAGEAVMEITKVTTSDIGFKAGRTASTTQRFGVASTTGTGFEFGRTTATDCSWAKHRLPNPENHCLDGNLMVTPQSNTNLPFGGTSVKTNFVDALGLTWPESATLMGVHTLGRTSGAFSGYQGWWSVPEEQGKFNNDYFKSIIQRGWKASTGPQHTGFGAGDKKKVQWDWVGQGSNSPANMPVMMLSSDMCLFYDMSNTLSSGGQGACAWNIQGAVGNNPLLPGPTTEDPAQAGFHCGTASPALGIMPALGECCGNHGGAATDSIFSPGGPGVLFGSADDADQTPQHLRDLARSNTFFYTEFLKVWTKATTNGFENTLTPLQAQCSNDPPTPSPPSDSPTLSPTIAVTTKPTTNFPTKFPTKKGAPPTFPPTIFPTPAPTLGSGSEPTCWTPWFNRDTPSGTGEWETLQALSKENPQAFIDAGCGFDIYSNTVGTPLGVECADAYSGLSLANLFDDFTNGIKCTPEEGLVCLTSDQRYGTCSNYRIRFNCCESSGEAAATATTLTFQDDNKKECKMIMKDGKLVSTCPIEAPLTANADPSFIRNDVDNLEKRMTALEERMNTRISAIERNL